MEKTLQIWGMTLTATSKFGHAGFIPLWSMSAAGDRLFGDDGRQQARKPLNLVTALVAIQR